MSDVGKHEVTERQASTFARATGVEAAWTRSEQAWLPARGLSWDEARRYAAWAGLRLPTRAEWWAAALGDDGRPYPWGHAPPDVSRCNALPGGSLRVGLLAGPRRVDGLPGGASPAGCLNMIGNVAEWLADGGAPEQDASGPRGADAESLDGRPIVPAGPASGLRRTHHTDGEPELRYHAGGSWSARVDARLALTTCACASTRSLQRLARGSRRRGRRAAPLAAVIR